MNTTDQDLIRVVGTISTVIATMLELQTTLAEVVTPLAKNLNERQQADLLYALNKGRGLATDLRETANQLASAYGLKF